MRGSTAGSAIYGAIVILGTLAQPRSLVLLSKFGILEQARSHARIPRAKQQCPKQDPRGKGDLLVVNIPSLLAISLGKGQNGTEIFVPLKSVPDMAS